MELLVPVALYGWLPVVLVIFRDWKGHRALVVAYVTAWLFLPSSGIEFAGLPDYTKVSATSLGMMLAVWLSEPRRIMRFRLHPADLLMIVYCLSPIPSALSNSLGLWDGCSNTLDAILLWGTPYFLGRLYFDSFEKIKTLATGIFVGGLVYVPFCLFEIRMSPQLYNWIYGYRLNTLHSHRYGGWRPVVFLSTGLELGMWMTAASLMGFALWYSGALRRLAGVSTGMLLLPLAGTAVLCKSTGALLLLAGGVAILVAVRMLRSPWPVLCVVFVPLLYLPIRGADLNDGQSLVEVASRLFGPDRAQSLEFRFRNEKLLAARALEAPWLGWGGWGREKVQDEYGEDQTICDGLWIILWGKQGLLGLLPFFGSFLLAPTLAIWRFGRGDWPAAEVGPVLGIALLLLLYMIDCLLNAMANPLYALCLGAVTTLAFLPLRRLGIDPYSIATEAFPVSVVPRRRVWPPPRRRSELREPLVSALSSRGT